MSRLRSTPDFLKKKKFAEIDIGDLYDYVDEAVDDFKKDLKYNLDRHLRIIDPISREIGKHQEKISKAAIRIDEGLDDIFYDVNKLVSAKKVTPRDPDKTWTKEEIREKLVEDDRWLLRAIIAVHNKQTQYEKKIKHTRNKNRVGFNIADAKYLSSIAEWIKSGKKVTYKQKYKARILILKYASQLAKIANKEI